LITPTRSSAFLVFVESGWLALRSYDYGFFLDFRLVKRGLDFGRAAQ
jgi:hypothetical protein